MNKKVTIVYLKKADKFLARNPHKLSKKDVDQLIIKAIEKIYNQTDTNIDLKRMKTLENHFRIRKGDIRIVFHLADDGNWIVSVVEEIGYRGDVYK